MPNDAAATIDELRARTRTSAADNDLITEGAVSDAFTREYRDRLRYDHHVGKWFLWDGTLWRGEETKLAYRWAHQKAKALAAIADKAKAIISAGRASFAAGVERLAQSDRAFAVTSEIWDSNPWLLGTPDGVGDLKTGAVRPAEREDYISKTTAVAPADTPDCPRWLNFLNQVTNSNDGLIRFLRQWCGYCLTGSTREHALLFIYGPGGNGKSVFLNTVFGILGEYAAIAAMDTFTDTRNDRHLTFLAMLKGARLVSCSETEEGRAWAEVKIKQLTGGDPITANFMRQNPFTFLPVFKLMIAGNHQPVLRNVDDAARRRFNVVPFTFTPPKPDRDLEEKLRAEGPAILRWMIDGCIDWQMNGLIRPKVVIDATAEYFSEQDTFAQWLEDCCETAKTYSDTTASLFASWRNYALARSEEIGSAKRFSTALQRRGFTSLHDVPEHRNQRGFRGIKVKVWSPQEAPP